MLPCVKNALLQEPELLTHWSSYKIRARLQHHPLLIHFPGQPFSYQPLGWHSFELLFSIFHHKDPLLCIEVQTEILALSGVVHVVANTINRHRSIASNLTHISLSI